MTAEFRPIENTLAAGSETRRVVIVGLGAIGSQVADAVARSRLVRAVCLIDPDRVDASNVWSQLVMETDVDRPKVTVHARRMRRINPSLSVETWRRPVEQVPLGVLRDAVVLSAPDARQPRLFLSTTCCWNLGLTMIDAGVEQTGWLARVTIFVPGADTACQSCLMSDAEYQQLEQRYLCADGTPAAPPTHAPSALSALAAALQGLELRKVLEGRHDHLLVSRQLVIDCLHHRHFVTTLRRNPRCRFPHDALWEIVELTHGPRTSTIDELFALVCPGADAPDIGVPGTWFISRLTCRRCGAQRALLRLANRLRPAEERCRACGGEMLAAGTDRRERLSSAELPPAVRARPLSHLGLETGDIVAVGDGGRTQYVQLGRLEHQTQTEAERHAGSNS
jgi:molybdopterin/thiamine biosynthesis adenylyltransferase